MRSSRPTRNCFRQARQGPYPAAGSTCAGCPYCGDLSVLRTAWQMFGSMGRVRNPVIYSLLNGASATSMRLDGLRISYTPQLALKLLVDVFLGFEPVSNTVQRALELLRSHCRGELHLLHGGVKVAFGAGDARRFIVCGPVLRVFLHVDAEHLERLVLLAFSLKLAAVAMQLDHIGQRQRFVTGHGGFVFPVQRIENARFVHLILKRSEERRVGKECRSRWS